MITMNQIINKTWTMRKTILSLLASFFLSCPALLAQPFQQEILQFKKSDSIVMPPKGQIVFAGSSSFTKWKDVAMYFPGYPIINRGFGGASLVDLIRYAEEAIIQYQPRQVFIYCGENDMADVDTVSPATVLMRFTTLHRLLVKQLPTNTKLVFVSIKPSIARWRLENKFKEANQLIRDFIATQKNTQFLDLHNAMLDEKGLPQHDIFIADNLHLNAKGYQIWQKAFAPYLNSK
jgi:lysophospholipase L1-like esterase